MPDVKMKNILIIFIDESADWKLVSCRFTPKKAVKLEFLADDSLVIMADKFGDVTSFSVVEPEKEGEVILGHLSMLLDCTFVCDGKFLVTADRDEKIRVSSYPNTYNIQVNIVRCYNVCTIVFGNCYCIKKFFHHFQTPTLI